MKPAPSVTPPTFWKRLHPVRSRRLGLFTAFFLLMITLAVYAWLTVIERLGRSRRNSFGGQP